IPLEGGMICWGAPGVDPPSPDSWDHSDPTNYTDCVAYGIYDGPSNPLIGDPTPLVPEDHSLVRIADTQDNDADFVCAETATPTNNEGGTVAVPATTPCSDARSSGIQVTPDDARILVSKD